MASPLQNRNARSQPPAGQGLYISGRRSPPFTNARVPGRVVPIPQHIRPFLDTTHVPSEDGFVPNPRPEARYDGNTVNDYYYKLCRLPSVRHPATNRLLSAYTGVELKAEMRFSGHQFDEYIFHAARQGRVFMFRVEKQHTLLGFRYPRGHESTRCRFAKCPIGGTIRSGQIRVCISEFSDPRNEILDPYHNAGYTHLYCLEKHCNLPSLLAETNITFLPAVELAKELSFPPALNIAERDTCLQWARAARQSWRDFKSTYPIAEARPRYKPSLHQRLYHRLDQIREASNVSNKRGHRDHDGPQVYTYNTQVVRNLAPVRAPTRLGASPPGILNHASLQRNGPQVFQAVPGFLHQNRSPPSNTQLYYDHNFNTIASSEPLLKGLAGITPTQLHGNDFMVPGLGTDYSAEESGALMAQDFADFLDSALEEFTWDWPAADPANNPPQGATPEQSTQPEQDPDPEEIPEPLQAPEPVQTNQPVAIAKYPGLVVGRRRSRRSSAPAVLGAHRARVRKSFKASRRRSKTKGVCRVWPEGYA